MSVQEKRTITNIISSIVITTIYFLIIMNRYNTLTLDVLGELTFWAKSILLFIPISIVARIIILILFHIGDNIANEIKGETEDEYDLVDERDKLIELKATQISLIAFSIGFVIALGVLGFFEAVTGFFITMLVAGLLSDVLSESMKLVYYRRGI